MKVPALAARAPPGATKLATGTGEARMSLMISRIEASRPPGVSRRSTTSCAPSRPARSRPRCTKSAVAGPIAASIGMTSTGGVAAGAATIQKTASSVGQRAAMPGLPLQPLQERRQQIHRQRKYDGRILVRADDRERFQVTQLDCLRLLRQ